MQLRHNRLSPSVTYATTALLGLLFAIVLVLGLPTQSAQAATCTDSLQAKIDAAPSGGTVTANPCIYRQEVVINKPITLQGQPGSEIRGSDVWTGWRQSGSVYVSTKTVPSLPASGNCEPGYDCLKPEQVFLNGAPLRQVANGTTPSTGQFSLDSTRHVILRDNPSGKTVEVSVRRKWISGAASNVTIKGFIMKHAANDSAGWAALRNSGYANWTLQDSSLSHTHGSLVAFGGASGLKLLRNRMDMAGHMAITSNNAALTVSDNNISQSNASHFDPIWTAGAVRTVKMQSVLVENNEVHHNGGNGIWCDGDCYNAIYRGNRVHHNAWCGILFEISHGAKIYDNVLYENGWGRRDPSGGSWQAAIHITNSRNAEIYNNTLAWNKGNISVTRSNRGSTLYNDVYGNYVHDNSILSKDYASSLAYNAGGRTHALAWVDKWDGKLYASGKNNRGFSNDYYFATSENSTIPRFMWGGLGNAITSLSTFNATPGEEQGRYMSQSEKDALIKSKGIPALPEH